MGFHLKCFQYDKDTKKKANHNCPPCVLRCAPSVSNTTKILKRKQITTPSAMDEGNRECFQYDKDTKKKANHNILCTLFWTSCSVSNTTKILKRKQITTGRTKFHRQGKCFQYDKDTKKKANHNRYGNQTVHTGSVSNTTKILKRKQITTGFGDTLFDLGVFPIRQRY